MEEKKTLSADYLRRFGVEIEINAFDGKSKPSDDKSYPAGMYQVGTLVQSITNETVVLHRWGHDHNNNTWIVKPDGSCGLEICSPVSKGWHGLKSICKVVDAFSKNPSIKADKRCSLHVHVDISDLLHDQLGSVLKWWIKSEPVFLDSVPDSRKRSRYCQFLGLCDMFEHDSDFTTTTLIKKLGSAKYGTLNTFHLSSDQRASIEFRIMDGECCLNPYMVKNWVRLVIHFVEMAVRRGPPEKYEFGNPWTGYCWLDPLEVFQLLGFDGSYELSPGLKQVKSWFLHRLLTHGSSSLPGVMNEKARELANSQYKELISASKLNIMPPNDQEQAVFSNNFHI